MTHYTYSLASSSDSLCHYGILGMKWGVRRTPEQLGHRESKASKDPRNMSDSELNNRINRMNKEKQYKDLTKSGASKLGQRIVEGILIVGAIEVTKSAFTGQLREGMNKLGPILKEVGPVLLKNHVPAVIKKQAAGLAAAGNMWWELEKDLAKR